MVTTSFSVKEHSNYSVISDASIALALRDRVLVNDMNEMEFKVVVLTIDSMLRGGVHMELGELERPSLAELVSVVVIASSGSELDSVRVVKELLFLIIAVIVSCDFQISILAQMFRLNIVQVNRTLLHTSIAKRPPSSPIVTVLIVVI